MQRIHAACPYFAPELIDELLIGRLEMEFAASNCLQPKLDEQDRFTEKWIDNHERQAETARKHARTRHS